MQRYTVPTKRRQLLVVSEDVHRMVKIHAREKGLTMAEATCVLLRKAILDIEGIHTAR